MLNNGLLVNRVHCFYPGMIFFLIGRIELARRYSFFAMSYCSFERSGMIVLRLAGATAALFFEDK